MSKWLSCVAVVALVGLFAGATPLADAPKLEGMWVATAGEQNGEKLPADKVDGTTFRVTGDKLIAANKDGKEFINATYTTAADKKPCEIMLKLTGSNEGKTLAGLVERNADEVRIIYALEGGEKPTEFKTKDKQVMFTLKPQK